MKSVKIKPIMLFTLRYSSLITVAFMLFAVLPSMIIVAAVNALFAGPGAFLRTLKGIKDEAMATFASINAS